MKDPDEQLNNLPKILHVAFTTLEGIDSVILCKTFIHKIESTKQGGKNVTLVSFINSLTEDELEDLDNLLEDFHD